MRHRCAGPGRSGALGVLGAAIGNLLGLGMGAILHMFV